MGNSINPETGEKRSIPFDFVLYRMATQMYHCPPSALGDEDYDTVMRHWDYHNIELDAAAMRAG